MPQPAQDQEVKNPHAPMMSRPLVSTIATVDRADAPKSNQKGEEKSGFSY
jgi:hypothetical protein